MKRGRTVRTTFKDGQAGLLWLARTNESFGYYTQAAAEYREAGYAEDAERCEAEAARRNEGVKS